MIKLIKDLVYPTLKNTKHYYYQHYKTGAECTYCRKQRKKGMIFKKTSSFICRVCYLKHKATDLHIHLPKRKLALCIFGLVCLLLVQTAFLVHLAFVKNPNGVSDTWLREYIIETYYPLSDKRISKDTFIQVVDAIIKYSSMPELAFAIVYHESRFNPSAVSSTGARGVHQVLAGKQNKTGWIKRLTEDGVIVDYRDLNDPLIGVKAGDMVLGYHMAEVKGDLPKALMGYYGTKNPAENLSYMKKVLATYGMIKYAEKRKMKSPSWGTYEATYP